jgi:protein-disulfide isomerase
MKNFIDKYAVPLSIIVAGLFVAGAVLLANNIGQKKDSLALADLSSSETEVQDYYLNALPISENDRILGNKDAEVKVVTYADMACSYCMLFEDVMKEVVTESNGKVAWVFRHFPLDPNGDSGSAAIASECLADLKGEDKFWEFMSKFKDTINAGEVVDVRAIALSLGASANGFDACYNSDKFSEKINNDFNNALESGLQGTPYSVVFADGEPVDVIDGAYPIEDVRAILDQYL